MNVQHLVLQMANLKIQVITVQFAVTYGMKTGILMALMQDVGVKILGMLMQLIQKSLHHM